ncbi:unnamed protein product [marine sediment metagenome]|uniref:Uncharacterized protein n=1 Tax=marine sediment metagenome TaxID=412755 RepID=X1PJT7_9ZZZZ
MRTSLILSRGTTGYMILHDKKPHYFSSVSEVAKLIAELIQPETENDLVMLTISTLKKKETTKEVKP